MVFLHPHSPRVDILLPSPACPVLLLTAQAACGVIDHITRAVTWWGCTYVEDRALLLPISACKQLWELLVGREIT